MSEELTYKDRIRRTELAFIHPEFLKDARGCRRLAGIPEGEFFCMQRALHWDRCQKREQVPENWIRPEGWVPTGFYPDEQWGMEKWRREHLKWRWMQNWMPEDKSQEVATPRGPWPPLPGSLPSPPPGEDCLSLLAKSLVWNWGLLPTAEGAVRDYLLTKDDTYMHIAALAYPIDVEVDPVEGATVTIGGLHPNVTQRELQEIWKRIGWRLAPYALLWPDLFGRDRYQIKRRPNQQRDFFIYQKVEGEGMTMPGAMDEWLRLHPERLDRPDSDDGAVRKAYERLRKEIEAMGPKEYSVYTT